MKAHSLVEILPLQVQRTPCTSGRLSNVQCPWSVVHFPLPSCWWSANLANTWQLYGSDICKSPGSAASWAVIVAVLLLLF